MVGVNDIRLYFGERALFDGITFIINKQDRIGLVGKNGAGKTTLLKTLAKLQKTDGGSIAYPSEMTIGYLPQDMDFTFGKTVLEETRSVFSEALQLQDRLDELNHALAEREDYESDSYMALLDELAELNERLNLIGGVNIEAEIEKILLGLGFLRTDFDRQTEEFSGGWRMRIELAKILLKQSDLLLLDEPTNHLDIESIQWLESFLKSYPGAVVLISHDRAFLDHLTNRTVEISLGRIYDYPAPYTKYLNLRAERRAQEIAAYENQQRQIKQTEAFIDRFRAKASKAVQVQSRIKQLEKLDRIEIDIEDTSAIRFYFPPAPRSGKVVVKAENIRKQYDDTLVFDKVNYSIERGEKVAFVGKNGEGKSTMSRLITGEQMTAGSMEMGSNVQIGYYAQNQADVLDKEKSVFQTIDDAAKGEVRTKIRNLLGSFLFSGEDVDKKVKVLSGGERARLAMCKLLLEPVNLLILDEPTNHLDIRSKDILKDALKRYDGTMILISHDRDFLDGLTEKIYEFGQQKVKEHLGGIYDFLERKKASTFREWETQHKPKQQKAKKANSHGKDVYELRKSLKQAVRKWKNEVNKLEKEIAKLEADQEKLNDSLRDPSFYADPANQQQIKQWEENSKQLATLMEQWEEAQLQLEIEQEKLAELD